MRKLILAALLIGTAATPALAQEAAAPFTGVRVEAIVGYDTTDIEDEGSNGIVYGAGVGYDLQAGNLVFGADAELSKSTIDECVSGVSITGDELCAEAGRELTVGGRIGAVVSPSTLLYARAGYTNARINLEYDNPNGTSLDTVASENLDGVRVGAGLEQAIGTNAFVRGEYRYSNYEQGYDRHQAVVGVGLRF